MRDDDRRAAAQQLRRARPGSSHSVSVSTLEVASSSTRMRRVVGERAREGEELALAGREVAAALADALVEAAGQRADEAAAFTRRAASSTVARRDRRGRPSAMLLATSPLKRKTSWSTTPISAAERAQVPLADVDARRRGRGRAHVVEARSRSLMMRRLAGAGRADDRDRLARLDAERDVAQHPVLALVGEPHVVEDDLAASARRRRHARRCAATAIVGSACRGAGRCARPTVIDDCMTAYLVAEVADRDEELLDVLDERDQRPEGDQPGHDAARRAYHSMSAIEIVLTASTIEKSAAS